ncbi:MAG: hypothetical protein N2510_02185, partial [Ignavibacteria bacterium]|nr:hypothetical protein [Ignavibacteria bacterium]
MKKSILIIFLLTSDVLFTQSWQVVSSSPSVMLTDMCFLPDGQNGWAVGSTSAQSNILNGLYKTTNGGVNWTQIPVSNT